ncbi:MAG: hypothetical protein JSV62_06050 [Promethearchaeota archaeon]|nr:MAG: hypothetical protein JSV62_06050 [Candidatus Lokiarchaeota archaeon]
MLVDFNYILDLALLSLSLILIVTAVVLLLINYLGNRHIHMLYLMIAWFSLLINNICRNLHIFIFYMPILAFIDNFFAILGSLFIVFFGESISRKSPSIKKLIWYFVFITLYSYSSLLNYIIYPQASIPEEIFTFNSNISNYSFIILMFTGSFLMPYYLFKIYRVAPRSLKKYTFISFVGGIIFGIITPSLLIILRQISPIFVLSSSVGMLIIVSAVFIKNPKLAFILPFKVIRLSVINLNSGTLLFSHNWKSGKELKSDDLLSAMLQGIIMILRESLGKGDLQEINLEKAIVLAHKSNQFPLVYILIATNISKSLKNGLEMFVKRFEAEFNHSIDEAIISGRNLPASEIISDTFSFLPD